MAAAEETTTQTGSLSPSETKPPVSKARKITPIVFWASCKPWPSAIAAAERVCAPRKPRLVRDGFRRRNPHMIASISRKAKPKPTSGDSTIGMTTLSRITDQCTTLPEAMAAPTSPPMRACEDDGEPEVPGDQVPGGGPEQPADDDDHAVDRGPARDDDVGDRVGHLLPEERADQVHDGGHRQGDPRSEGAGGHRGGDGVRGVMEPVGEVEAERDRHEGDDDGQFHLSLLQGFDTARAGQLTDGRRSGTPGARSPCRWPAASAPPAGTGGSSWVSTGATPPSSHAGESGRRPWRGRSWRPAD